MRYEDWDVLLFPKDSKVPMKEFKTSCHVVHDGEFAYSHGSFGLPTMTCFMPGLTPGTPFNISLHSWKTPEVSQFTRNYSKHVEHVKFDARVLIDGRLVATSSFNRTGPWPQLINHSFGEVDPDPEVPKRSGSELTASSEFTKNGDLEILKFPTFRKELLQQSYWSPADELGRIKIVISEGFPRDSLTVPMERVKNVVAFSFQHAPIDILETSGIAWPNPAMWRRGPYNPTMPVPAQQHEDGPEAHIHSPRRRSISMKASSASGPLSANLVPSQMNPNSFLGNMPNTQGLLQRSTDGSTVGCMDPFDQPKADSSTFFDWAANFGPAGCPNPVDTSKGKIVSRKMHGGNRVSASDTSMPDYSSGCSEGANIMMTDFQPMNFTLANVEDADISNNNLAPKAPTNTPTALTAINFSDDFGIGINKVGTPSNTPPTNEFFAVNNGNFSSELATTLTHSLLNQPLPLPVQPANIPLPADEIRSRKENRMNDTTNPNTSLLDHVDMRKVSQPAFGQLGKLSRDTGTSNDSPSSQNAFSAYSNRSLSGPDFGQDLTNTGPLASYVTHDMSAPTETRIGSVSDRNIKRTRQFTPASAKAIDDEDEPRRSSPRVRIGSGGQAPEVN
ncbi:hypothetical protein GGR57DRAFT_502104 [Xylariaceae sp. FL1272]|nr:hypothetical protein GGR57DRAFT_502104 [Xylariaceae sp. FL1272]